ncbi:MAG: suppressor of fused domain protein [Erysipelotrichaceae bacterium]|nr:suppressor of fused domain protein [Erysipelotrichaceae bacterium]
MNVKEMDKLTEHFDRYFQQNDCEVMHPLELDPHIDVLVYKPNEKYHFWKLATMGASDYKMKANFSLGNRNEYLMFVDADEDLDDKDVLHWYYTQLMEIALYPVTHDSYLTVGHSIEWKPEEGEEMIGAFIDFPMIIEDTGILRCKLGLMKTAVCLQTVLLNRQEMDQLLASDPQQFSEYLYPEDGSRKHFLSQRKRTDRF